jgi:hypothetical protein
MGRDDFTDLLQVLAIGAVACGRWILTNITYRRPGLQTERLNCIG